LSQIDADLMSDKGAFTLEQLMELAGLACAQTLAKVYTQKKVLVITGPGNQVGLLV
jgi:NAD(P)H-hydrate epimerase